MFYSLNILGTRPISKDYYHFVQVICCYNNYICHDFKGKKKWHSKITNNPQVSYNGSFFIGIKPIHWFNKKKVVLIHDGNDKLIRDKLSISY